MDRTQATVLGDILEMLHRWRTAQRILDRASLADDPLIVPSADSPAISIATRDAAISMTREALAKLGPLVDQHFDMPPLTYPK